MTKEAAHPYLPHSIKASAGAALKIKISKSPLAVNSIPLNGANVALEFHGEALDKTKWSRNVRLWVGEEGPGLSLSLDQKKKMKFVTISTNDVESLNAMVSTSLAIWEWRKQNDQ